MRTLTALLTLTLLPAAAGAQTPERPLPKFVQKLSPTDFKLWAAWQNRQADARQAERANDPLTAPPVLRGSRLVATSTGYGTARRGTAHNGRGNSKAIMGYADVYATVENVITRYVNPDYTPTPRVYHNPYVKPNGTGALGEPDWDRLFVPCDKGTMTMTEALMEQRGPVDPEKLYARLLAPFFLD